nr:BREX-1 system adenine-specific DNA-methyltransferase PglX [uncultured Prevotella sp.]
MDTSGLKRFATEARNILIAGVMHRLEGLGFDLSTGKPSEIPQKMEGGAVFMGEVTSTTFYNQWISLNHAVTNHSVRDVVEEAAYTWFNRLIAIRIMSKRGLIAPVLTYESKDIPIPLIVSEARQGRLPEMPASMRQHFVQIMEDDNRTNEQFALLIVAFCHSNPIINRCFGTINDYTELLLPQDILRDGGYVDLLNHTDFITDEDYKSAELIGWLYQFYISERKDEVFAKKGKYDPDEIAPATQIFTPNWIVKYMVENTVGRMYLDNNPSEKDLKDQWKYLVDIEPRKPEDIYHFEDLEDLRLGDLACGSGHILNEFFNILFLLYTRNAYSRRQAIENIFQKNLIGIDLDTRAKQLATFSLLMKACDLDRDFLDARIMPRVYDMPQPFCEAFGKEIPEERDNELSFIKKQMKSFITDGDSATLDSVADAIALMDHADTLGSIMKFNISEHTRSVLLQSLQKYEQQDRIPEEISIIIPYVQIILALTEQYSALAMNPPYMGSGKFEDVLSKYVKDNYPDSKADLFAVFMDVSTNLLAKNGKYGMINMQSWMFLSSFEKLRTHLLETEQIDSLLHLGPHTFDELSGEVVQNTTFVISKAEPIKGGTYYRLVNGKDCEDKRQMFIAREGCFENVSQADLEKIPGAPIGYWVSSKVIEIFNNTSTLRDFSRPRLGQNTGDNNRFLREWFEINYDVIGFKLPKDYKGVGYKWIPYTKGGLSRRWYGPSDTVIDWKNDGEEVKAYCVIRNHGKHWSRYIQSYDCFYKAGMVFPRIGSGLFCTRYINEGTIYDVNAPGCFPLINQYYLLAYLNSNVIHYFLSILCPTLTFQVGDVSKVPCKIINSYVKRVEDITKDNVAISKQDWDAHETSWDFKENELLRIFHELKGEDHANESRKTESNSYDKTKNSSTENGYLPSLKRTVSSSQKTTTPTLLQCLERYKSEWTEKFMQLHDNEEELNRQFIDIYGLQDELTPDVPLNEITILQQGEISIED